MNTILKVRNLHKSYGSLVVLNGVSLEIEKGKTKVVIGPSGTGKSTLLYCINYITPPTNGEVYLEDILIKDTSDINKIRTQIGFVFQDFNLFSHLTALENVSIGPKTVKGLTKKEAYELAMDELSSVGLEEKANAYPAELSGGQQQRVSIARALAMKPKLILFDEPTSALDPELTEEVIKVMIKLAQNGMTMLVVSHEMRFVNIAADEILFLDQGKIIESGPPKELIVNAKHEKTKRFLSRISGFED